MVNVELSTTRSAPLVPQPLGGCLGKRNTGQVRTGSIFARWVRLVSICSAIYRRMVISESVKIGPSSRLHAKGAQGRQFDARSLRDACRHRSLRPNRSAPTNLPTPVARVPARGCEAVGTNKRADAGRFDLRGRHQQNLPSGTLPDRAWRFGPTATLSGRGDQFLGDAGRVERSARHRRIVPAPVASSRGLVGPSGSRMRRHRWLQANELPTPVASTDAVGASKRQDSLRKKLPRSPY